VLMSTTVALVLQIKMIPKKFTLEMSGSHFWSIQLNVTFDTKGLFIVIIIILYSFLMFVTISLDRPRVFVAILVVLMKNQNYKLPSIMFRSNDTNKRTLYVW
jgi:hypothetical protein